MKHTYSSGDTETIAQEVLHVLPVSEAGATVLALSGELGAGKTTLTQAIATVLGVTESVVSPTFVIAKWYTPTKGDFTTLVHIDAYRINDESELGPLGFASLLLSPKTLIVIEWPEKIPLALADASVFHFALNHHKEERSIEGPIAYEKNN